MKFHLFSFMSLIFLFSCSDKSRYAIPDDLDYQGRSGITVVCSKDEAYIPDTSRLELTPKRILRVNFHIMQRADGTGNFTEKEAEKYIEDMMWVTNKTLLDGNTQMNLPIGNKTPVLPLRYEYQLSPDPSIPGDKGIYFHQDDELYYMIYKGRNNNLFDRRPFEKYGVQKDKVLNIFLMGHHKDSLVSPTYRSGDSGVAFGNFVKLVGLKVAHSTNIGTEEKPRYRSAWSLQGLLHHEIGHCLGLPHTWGRDQCDDTPLHPNCWNYGTGECKENVSNNVMDYNMFRNAWTPCQLGIVHRNLTMQNQRQRKMLVKNWCDLDEEKNVLISSDEIWQREVDLFGHLIIEANATLTLTCRVSLPRDAKILIQPGGTLILERTAILNNDCGDMWDGIIIQEKGGIKGKVKYYGKPRIENVKNGIDLPES